MTQDAYSVLLVDDDPAVRRLISRQLEVAGFDVRIAVDGDDAYESVQRDCPHVLITDWDMPGLNGLELCRRIRQLELPHYVYIVFLTAKNAAHDTIKALDAGADDFLTKPIVANELLARLRSGARILSLESRLKELAGTDPLTGLPIRRTFYEQIDREWERATRYRLPLCCVFLDIDHFKMVNDTHGHHAGDAFLKLVADVLRRNCRATDSPCRYGGEEFCVLLPETTEPEAAVWAERVRRAIESETLLVKNETVSVQVSLGVAQRTDDVPASQDLINLADQALLVAKRSGRNRVVRFRSLNDSNTLEMAMCGAMCEVFRTHQARDVMTTPILCLKDTERLHEAADLFLRLRINSAPVVDGEGRLVGIVSEKDLLAATLDAACWELPISTVMRTDVVAYDEDAPVQTIHEFFRRVNIRRVVVVRDQHPVGVVSRGSLLRWLGNWGLIRGHRPGCDQRRYREVQLERSTSRLVSAADVLQNHADDLKRHVNIRAEDFIPRVVNSATCMQEMLVDLLAGCQVHYGFRPEPVTDADRTHHDARS